MSLNRDKIRQEILDTVSYPTHGLLSLSPRSGKTRITIEILKKEKSNKILWITPNTKLRDKDIPSEFIKWKAKKLLEKTDIICYASLHNHKGNYDKIILDEYQSITWSNMKPLFNGNIKYKTILGLSGTHPKHKDKQDILNTLNLKILYELDIKKARDLGIISPYQIYLVPLELDTKDKYIVAGNKDKRFYQTEQAQYSYLTSRIENTKLRFGNAPKEFYFQRMRFIYNLKTKLIESQKLLKHLKGRTLIFSGSIEFAEKLSKNTYHSKTDDKNLQKFLNKEIPILSCVNAGGIGFTYEGVDNFVIVQVNSNKLGDVTQKIMRACLLQENYIAKIYILYIKNTVDEDWLKEVLETFDKKYIYEKGNY